MFERQIAEKLCIHYDTYWRLKAAKPELAEALKKGEALQIKHVENALFKKCVGYFYEEEKEITDMNGNELCVLSSERCAGNEPVSQLITHNFINKDSMHHDPSPLVEKFARRMVCRRAVGVIRFDRVLAGLDRRAPRPAGNRALDRAGYRGRVGCSGG